MPHDLRSIACLTESEQHGSIVRFLSESFLQAQGLVEGKNLDPDGVVLG